MDDLRLILLLSGVFVILAVYAWTRYQRRPRKRSPVRSPSLDGQHDVEPDAADVELELQRMGRLMAEPDSLDKPVPASAEGSPAVAPQQPARPPKADSVPEKRVLVISVVAGSDRSFDGRVLRAAFEHNRLEFHSQGIFQRLVDVGERRRPVFGIASIVEPGVFESAEPAGLSVPGITLYLQLPAPIASLEAFDDFVTTAERLAVELGGELRDQQKEILTHQTLMQIREELSEHAGYPAS